METANITIVVIISNWHQFKLKHFFFYYPEYRHGKISLKDVEHFYLESRKY